MNSMENRRPSMAETAIYGFGGPHPTIAPLADENSASPRARGGSTS